MVLPGEELKVDIKHVGMKNGNLVVKITTSNITKMKETTTYTLMTRCRKALA